MFVKEYMTRDPVVLQPHQSIFEAKGLLYGKGFRHLPVVDEERLVGVITQTDLLAASLRLAQQLEDQGQYIVELRQAPVGEHMTREPICADPDCTLQQAASLMRDKKIGCLPIVDEDMKVVGIITETDLFDALTEMLGFFGEAGPGAGEVDGSGEEYVL